MNDLLGWTVGEKDLASAERGATGTTWMGVGRNGKERKEWLGKRWENEGW